MSLNRTCSVGGCTKPHDAKGFCKMHYARWRAYGDPLALPKRLVGADAIDKLAARMKIDAETGCWLWQGASRNNYGTIWVDGRCLTSHRVAYELLVGPVPDGMDVDHVCHSEDLTCQGGATCRHRLCFNPDHLEPVTRRENAHRGRGLHGQTHCKYGHELTPENTYAIMEGRWVRRRCRICESARRLRRRRNRASQPA